MRRFLLVLVALAACRDDRPEPLAPSPSASASVASAPSALPTVTAPAPSHAACRVDADCIVSTFRGCCGCCEVPPFVTSKAEDEDERRSCAAVNCAGCAGARCDPPSTAPIPKAACIDGACRAR